MMRKPIFTVISLLLLALPGLAQLKEGQKAPTFKPDRFLNTRLRSLDPLKKRLVLYIWIDPADEGCKPLVTRVHQLLDSWGRKGFASVFLTHASLTDVKDYIHATSLRAPVVVERDAKSFEAFGFHNRPSAALVAPDGNITWIGHPQDVSRDDIEMLLRKVKTSIPIGQPLLLKLSLPKADAAIAKEAAEGRLGKAFLLLEQAEKRTDLSEEDAALLRDAKDEVLSLLELENAVADRADQIKRYREAESVYARIATHYEGHPLAASAKKRSEEISKDPKAFLELEASSRIEEAEKCLAKSQKKAALQILEEIMASPLKNARIVKDKNVPGLIESLKK